MECRLLPITIITHQMHTELAPSKQRRCEKLFELIFCRTLYALFTDCDFCHGVFRLTICFLHLVSHTYIHILHLMRRFLLIIRTHLTL